MGNLSVNRQIGVEGRIGNGTTGAADVDWYSFTLDRPSSVTLTTLNRQLHNPLVSVLSLYNGDAQKFRGTGQVGYQLVVQDDSVNRGSDARIDRSLAAGTYYVAVSGSGNRYFHPLIAGSGYPGSTGDYGLLLAASARDFRPGDGPAVLASDPAPGADLDRSPFVIRLNFSTALDPSSIRLGQNVQLVYNPGVPLLGGNGRIVSLASYTLNTAANELQLTPAAPLRLGRYDIVLAGDRTLGQQVLRDPSGNPLGKSAQHPSGDDYTMSFQISGVKGNTAAGAGADDTPATARMLGELAGAGLVQIAGAIGDDPTDPVPFNRADVDVYHFHIGGTGRYAFTAEVFAGRIGSPLNPAASLFRLDPSDSRLHFVESNDDSFNTTITHDGTQLPLFQDPLLRAGLTAGDYYLAVSGSGNVPDPALGRLPGIKGIFDPQVSRSGKNGSTTGNYVLNVSAVSMNDPPQVSAVTTGDDTPLKQGTILGAPPTGLSMRFDKTVNLRQLLFSAMMRSGQNQLDSVYIQGRQGNKFYPRLLNYTDSESPAEFRLDNALPNGDYQLHLSGAQGLTDLAGNPLVGNDPTGDYVISFMVDGPARGSNGNPLLWLNRQPNDDPRHPQMLGYLFPAELQAKVVIKRVAAPSSGRNLSDVADYFQFQLPLKTAYVFALDGSRAPSQLRLTLTDALGKPVRVTQNRVGKLVWLVAANLEAGSYIIGVAGWSPAQAPKTAYQVTISIGLQQEEAPPLSVGPGPAIRVRHVTGGPPALFVSPPSPDKISDTASVTPPPTTKLPAFDTPAVLPARPSSQPIQLTKNAPAGLQDLGLIPSGVLLLLAAGPIGGIGTDRASNAGPRPSELYQSLLARTPDSSFAEVVVQLPLLIPSQHSGTELGTQAAGGLPEWIQEVLRRFDKFNWARAVKILQQFRGWQEKVPIRPVEFVPDAVPDSTPPDDADPGKRSPESGDLQGEETSEESALPALAFAVALAALPPKKQPGVRAEVVRGGDRESHW